MRRPDLVWLKLTWPREVGDAQVAAFWRRLPALGGWPIVVEAYGRDGTVHHRLGLTSARRSAITGQLTAELPGIGVEEDDQPNMPLLQIAGRLAFNTRRRALKTSDLPAASRTVLAALSQARRDELILIQWVLGHPLHPNATPSQRTGLAPESWGQHVAQAVTGKQPAPDLEPRRALAAKQADAGWRAIGRVAVRAATEERREQLMRSTVGALRSLESPGLRLLAHRERPDAVLHGRLPYRWPLRLGAMELAATSGWPVGDTSQLPVVSLPSRVLPASRAVARTGRVTAESTYPGENRPLALTATSSLRHLHVLGPTGVGKSTLLLNLIVQDLNAGYGVVVIEPKGDLIADVLSRVPKDRVDDVVLLDPTDQEHPVGLNPLVLGGRSPELVADQLLGLFHSLYAAHWGPRTQDILGAALATLTQVPGMSLVAVPVLLTDPAFRRRVLSKVSDPVGLGPFWAGFEAWSEAERTTATAPVLKKLRPFLMRPVLRRTLGQARPRFDVRTVFTDRKVLLVNLAKGRLGPEAAALLGALVVSEVWQAALGRAAIAPEGRRPVFVYADEFQEYLKLPVDLGDALAQARGLGLSLTLANQHLGQLPPDVRSAVAANAQSKVCFRLGADDARVMAAGGTLAPEDFSGLGAFKCYLQLVAHSAVQPWASGRTLPAPDPCSDPEAVRAASRANYGLDVKTVDLGIEALVAGQREASGGADDLKPRRRGDAR